MVSMIDEHFQDCLKHLLIHLFNNYINYLIFSKKKLPS